MLLLGVLPLVLLSPLDSLQLLGLDLAGLLDNLGDMSVSLDATDLRHMCISLCQGFAVLQCLSLLRGLDTTSFRGIGAPQSDVAVVGARENVFRVWGPFA